MQIRFMHPAIGVIYEVRERIPQSQFSVYNYVTTDGGLTWKEYRLNKDFISSFNKLIFPSTSFGYFFSQGDLWRTDDTAKTWNIIYQQTPGQQGYAFDFIDASTGWLHFWAKDIGKTTDGGASWTLSPLPFMVALNDIQFADSRNGVAVGYQGTILSTSDGGIEWESETSFSNLPLTNISMVRHGNSAEYWLAGDGWNIQHKTITLTSTPLPEGKIPQVFSLDQNFPNPFNPSTKFTYHIPSRGIVTLTIYDLVGRAVALLVNEEKQAGRHSITWYASSQSGGVYFARLQSAHNVQTKKLILLK